MASRRMFSPDIVASDAFIEMPTSAQCLYFHLGMRADDDGFVNPQVTMRMVGANTDDLKILLGKRFLLRFESGVVVIKHWLIHNLIRADLYKETLYKKEKATLGLNENGAYTELREGVSEIKQIEPPEWLKRRKGELRTANVPQTARRLGKVRLGKVSLVESTTRTPKEDCVSFFDKGDTYTEVVGLLKSNLPNDLVDREVQKFILYWTEPNASGTKVRWQLQKTFDIKRRLRTWFERTSTRPLQKGKGIIL